MQGLQINQASCDIARKVASRRGTLVAGGLMQTGVYNTVRGTQQGKEEVQKELAEGLEVLIKNGIDVKAQRNLMR